MMKRDLTSARTDDRGFNLVELLIVAALTPMILGAAYLAFGAMTSNYSRIEATSEATGEAQRGLDTLVRELRQARQVQEGGGAFASATGSSCSFYCDVDLDGTPELVTYYVQGSDLYRGVGQPALQVYPYNFPTRDQTMFARVLNVGGMTSEAVFTYFNSTAPDAISEQSLSANLSTISAVGIRLLATRPSTGGLVSVDFSTKVKIRALFNSLS